VSEADTSRSCGIPGGDGAGLPSIQDLIARAQRLVESPRPEDGYPLKWYVEASLIGDITAITAAALHSDALLQR
jgi:hypothetical protein